MWHGTAKDELLAETAGSHLDRYAHVEAASYPLIPWFDNTFVSIAKSQMVFNKSLDGSSLVPEEVVELC